MAPERSSLTPAARAVVAVAPFLLAVLAVLLFDVVRDIPRAYTCGEEGPPGHDAVVDAYHGGAYALHLGVVALALGTLVLLSRGGGRGPLGVGWPTAVAVPLVAAATALALAGWEAAALVVFWPMVLSALGIAIVAEPFGARATGVLAALLLLGAAAWVRRAVACERTVAARTAIWALLLLAAGHLLVVLLQGEGVGLC